MNPIEPHLLTLCAEKGAAAAFNDGRGTPFVTVNAKFAIYKAEAAAREAMARAAIETYLAAQPADHAAEARIGVLTSLAANRLAACEQWQQDYYNLQVAHDALKARLALLEWRDVSVAPTAADAGPDGDVIVLCRSGDAWVRHWTKVVTGEFPFWRPVAPPASLSDPFAQWLATATPAERDAATRAGWEGGAR